MSKFKLLCQSCGLTMSAAADYLKVSENTAKSWWLDKRTCPDGVIGELSDLFSRIDRSAHEVVSIILDVSAQQGAAPAEFYTSKTDEEAQERGWPFASVHAAVGRRALEILDDNLKLKVLFT